MATELINRYPEQIESVNLHGGVGGAFEVSINDKKIYSKLETKKYPELDDVLGPLREILAADA